MNILRLTFDCRVFSAGLFVGTILGLIVNMLIILASGIEWIEIVPLCPWCRTNDLQGRKADTHTYWSIRQATGSIEGKLSSGGINGTINSNVSKGKLEIKVVCMVMLSGRKTSMVVFVDTIRKTWGKHCKHLTFYQLKVIGNNLFENIIIDKSIKTIELMDNGDDFNVKMMDFHLEALLHSLKVYVDSDWFIMVSMPTFVVLENLKLFLYNIKHSNEPHIYGDLRQESLTLDGGIVFNRKAASRLVCQEPDSMCCESRSNTFSETINTCFKEDSRTLTQPRGKDGRFLFNAKEPAHYFGYKENQGVATSNNTTSETKNLPSVFAVSFCGHNIQFLIETYFFLYRQEIRGIYDHFIHLPI